MIIKVPKPTKTEIIRTFLNQWDPLNYVDKAGFMFYDYEAEDIAQRIRKNSKIETIESIVREDMEDKIRIERSDAILDDEECRQMAILIHTWMNSQ